MSEPVIIALIGAGGAILAAVVTAVITRQRHPRPTPIPPLPVVTPLEEQAVNPAAQLFQRLVRERRKISYIDAYEALLGTRPQPWRNQVHCPEVIAAAAQSGTQVIQGLSVQLDALIVNRDGSQQPSDGHFEDHDYTREQWLQVFAAWPLAE